MEIAKLVREAGLNRKTVNLQFVKEGERRGLTVSGEFEPYSQKVKGDTVIFFCLDIKEQKYLDVELKSIFAAEVTDRKFRPRFPITF